MDFETLKMVPGCFQISLVPEAAGPVFTIELAKREHKDHVLTEFRVWGWVQKTNARMITTL